MIRPPRILHCTSEPVVFFGREQELSLLEEALQGGEPSVVALIGPGGQGKTAIVQHWLQQERAPVEGLFFWSFYRGKDVDLCLREWLAYAEGLEVTLDVSASWCAERLVRILREQRWAVVLDGTEVVQHEEGNWRGRLMHPDLGGLLEELASERMPGVVVLTTRFELPTLVHRRYVRLLNLSSLDAASARALLRSVGVEGSEEELDRVALAAGRHAKAVELLGTYLVRSEGGRAEKLTLAPGPSDEEASVARVLEAHRRTLSAEEKDVLALSTAFRDPPTEELLREYLRSEAVRTLLHQSWKREYFPFAERPIRWLEETLETLVRLRLLERVGPGKVRVIDAHPLVRRGFEHVAGAEGEREKALARAGFLRGRPDRRRPGSLQEAREAIELFHAHCDAGLWAEADSAYRALENPKHRFLAPGLERDLLLRFFPRGDWKQTPLWAGFGRWRSLAICLEMLGEYEEALQVYRPADAALRGDALLALGRLGPLLETPQMPAPWQSLWQAYRSHALCLAGQVQQAEAVARALVPVDVYEWTHVFECLMRLGRLDVIDLRSLEARGEGENRWAELARRRIRADYLRLTQGAQNALREEYQQLMLEYDQAGLPYERGLSRLSYFAWSLARGERGSGMDAGELAWLESRVPGLAIEGWNLRAAWMRQDGDREEEEKALAKVERLRQELGIRGPLRP